MKNRFLVLVLVLLVLPLGAAAEDITLQRATAVAEAFFAKCGAVTRGGSHLVLVNSAEVAATRSADVPFYIFNRREGGFVIVSGLDAACPVLGYSLENSFGDYNDMPENVRDWLDLYRGQIAQRRSSGARATQAELDRWKAAETVTRVEALPTSVDLQTPDWGQQDPYNRYCPLDSAGKRTLVGCIPVAMGEVMYLHRHPHHGTGTLPGYTKKGITLPALKLGHEYRWDTMLKKYRDEPYTDDQAEAVARLLFDIGMMMQVGYTASSTGGQTRYISRLADYMGYDKSVLRYARDYTSDAQWKSLLKEEIGAGYPVIFIANNGGTVGHCFVVDGYDSADRFLINWGWHSNSNGYYQLSAFGSYTIDQKAYFNIRPEHGGEDIYNFSVVSTTKDGYTYCGIDHLSGIISKGSSFSIRFGALCNYSFVTATGIEVNFAHKSRDGRIKEWLKDKPLTSSSLASGSSCWWKSATTLTVNETVEEGDYVEAMFRVNNAGEWRRFYNADNDQDDVDVKLPMHLSERTYVSFLKSSKMVRVKSIPGSKYGMYDSDGKLLKSGTIGAAYSSIDVSSYPSGEYELEVLSGEQSISVKLVF